MMFEVLECAWKELVDRMRQAKDLEQLIQAHQQYLRQIVRKALLGGSSTNLVSHLNKIFELILRFCYLQVQLYDGAMLEVSRRAEEQSREYKDAKAGKWGLTSSSMKDRKDREIPSFQEFSRKIMDIEVEYSRLLKSFLHSLRGLPTNDLRFLLFRLDFNEYYELKQIKNTTKVSSYKFKTAQNP